MSDVRKSSGLARRDFLRTAAVVGAGVPVLGAAACSPVGSGGGGEPSGSGGGGGFGNVTMWSWNNMEGSMVAYYNEVAEIWDEGEFEYVFLNNPEIFTKYKTALAGGDAPDIIGVENSSVLLDLARSDALTPLDDFIATLPELDPGTISYDKVDGQSVIVPLSVAALALNVNTDMLSELSIAPPTTLDELIDVTAELKRAGLDAIGTGFQDGLFVTTGIYMSCVANAVDGADELLLRAQAGEDVWDDPAWLEGAKYLKRLADAGSFSVASAGATGRDQAAQWSEQKFAMLWPAAFWMQDLIDPVHQDAFEYSIAPFPSAIGGAGRAVGGQATSFGIAPGQNEEGAKSYLSAIFSDEGTELLIARNVIPARVDFQMPAELPHPKFDQHVAQIPTMLQRTLLNQGWNDAVHELVPEVLFRGATAEDLAEAIKTQARASSL